MRTQPVRSMAATFVAAVGVVAGFGCEGSHGPGQAGAGTPPPVRLIGPLSTATVTSRRPTLKWELTSDADGAHVDICRDRACAQPVAAFDASGTSGAPESDLPSGVLFWRAHGRNQGVTSGASTPTWQFTVGARSAPVDGSWGTTLDVDGDGYADVVVGAGANGNGRAYVYMGGAAGLGSSPAVTLIAPAGFGFGDAVASAGDVNGDGYADVIVGAERVGSTHAGAAYLYLGSATGLAASPATTLRGPGGDFGTFGFPVAGAGDVNRDGYADVIVGASGVNGNVGAAYVYLGSATGLSASPAATLASPEGADGYFGNALASAGDTNGDGYPDVVVGALDVKGGAGRAYVYLGGASGLASSASITLDAPEVIAFLGFGASVANAGDVNGDGYADIIVGSAGNKAYVYLGGATGLTSSPDVTLAGADGGAFGRAVASAGDLNGDGYADVVVGASNLAAEGRAYLYLGGATGLPSSPAITLAGTDGESSEFGQSVASAGDVNGDGYEDLLVGAPGAQGIDTPAGLTGRTHLYLGLVAGVSTSPTTLTSPDGPDTHFGGAVATGIPPQGCRSFSMPTTGARMQAI